MRSKKTGVKSPNHLSGHTIRIEDVPVRRLVKEGQVDHYAPDLPASYDFTQQHAFAQAPIQQGLCGSCWSISTTQVLRDRANLFRVKHGRAPDVPALSYQLVADCASNCITYGGRRGCARSCNGGFLVTGFAYLKERGAVSDVVWPNRFQDEDGLEHIEQTNDGNGKSATAACPDLPASEPRIRCDNFYIVNLYDTFALTNARSTDVGMSGPQTADNERNIMREIYERGPVAVCFNLYSDFREFWKSEHNSDTVYQIGWQLPAADRARIDPVGRPYWSDSNPGPGGIVFKTGHSVSIVGWGEQADGTKYWICRNSWGPSPNTYRQGYFKIRRGINAAAIESDVATCWFRTRNALTGATAIMNNDSVSNKCLPSFHVIILIIVIVVIVLLHLMKRKRDSGSVWQV